MQSYLDDAQINDELDYSNNNVKKSINWKGREKEGGSTETCDKLCRRLQVEIPFLKGINLVNNGNIDQL